MDTLSLIIGVIVGSVSSYIGIWLKVKFGETFSMIFELMKNSKEIFTVNPTLPNIKDFEVLESVVKQIDENITPSNNTDKPKNNEPSKKRGIGLERMANTPKTPVNT